MADFRRVMVTGGAGFIGSNYVQYACRTHPDWEIVVLDKLTYAGNLENLEPVRSQIIFHHGDIANPEQVEYAMEGVDAVVNFAAESHVDRSLIDPRPFVQTNVEGTLVLLNEARKAGVQRFLHVSTDEVYGDLWDSDESSMECDSFAPRSPYAATKAGAEHLVSSFGVSHGMDVVITRGSNTYGPYQYPEKIIPLFISNAVDDKPLPIYGQGKAVRDYMHVDDHVAGIDLVLHAGESSEAYNLGAREQITGLELAATLLDTLGKPRSLMSFVTDRPGHDYRYSVDPSKAEELGWVRKWDFLSGLKQTCQWYLENEGWWRRIKEEAEFRNHEKRCYTLRS